MYLITGSDGQLGSAIKLLNPKNAIFAGRNVLDITDYSSVRDFVNDNNVDVIINCAAYSAVDKAEDAKEAAFRINSLGAENLAKSKCKLIHISTDYVFDGHNCKPYEPEDNTNPLSVYGKSKLNGEIAALRFAESVVVIRTSWLYSEYANNFLKTMLKLGQERSDLSVVYDQIGTPTYAVDLAHALLKIAPQINIHNRGIYHFSNEGVCSWYDFATAIMSLANLTCKIHPILSANYPTKAVRPHYSVLDKSTTKDAFGIEPRHWMKGLEECLKRF